jgi:hypothetical protein
MGIDKFFTAAAVVGWFVIILAITIGATISYHEHRMLDHYNADAEIRFDDRMEKLDKIEALIIKLKNRD